MRADGPPGVKPAGDLRIVETPPPATGHPAPESGEASSINPDTIEPTPINPNGAQYAKSNERILGDRELVAALRRCNFDGPIYRNFQEELAAYGLAILEAWMRSGRIFSVAAYRGFPLNPSDSEIEELSRDTNARAELANMTVALALPWFKEHALVRGNWKPERGASLATYFINTCIAVFPNEFRKRRADRKRWLLACHYEVLELGRAADIASDPAVIVSGNLRVRENLTRLDQRVGEIVALTIDGYTQEEIVEILGEPSVRAVEAVLYRWRTRERRNSGQGGDLDGQA